MKRRIMAWVLIASFVLVIADLLVIGWHREVAVGIYAVIVMYYLFAWRKPVLEVKEPPLPDNQTEEITDK